MSARLDGSLICFKVVIKPGFNELATMGRIVCSIKVDKGGQCGQRWAEVDSGGQQCTVTQRGREEGKMEKREVKGATMGNGVE